VTQALLGKRPARQQVGAVGDQALPFGILLLRLPMILHHVAEIVALSQAALGAIGRERQGPIGRDPSSLCVRRDRVAYVVRIRQGPGELRPGLCESGIERDRLLVVTSRAT
jgi:hypothetical protein